MKQFVLTILTTLFCLGSIAAAQSPPEIAPIPDTSIAEGDTLILIITATDPDGDALTMLSSTLPANADFADSGNGVASFKFWPDFTQAGEVPMAFLAIAGVDTTIVIMTITVINTNLPPELDPIADTTVLEGVTLSVTASASDPDGTIPALLSETLPANASLTDNGDGTALFAFTPATDQFGDHLITILAEDGEDTASVEFTVTVKAEVNEPPVLEPIPDTSIVEGDTLILILIASDPNGTFPGIDMTLPPDNSNLVNHGDGTATFTFTPSYIQGTPTPYAVLFSAFDGKNSVIEQVQITVIDAGNQVPIFVPVADTFILEGMVLTLNVAASDLDGTVASMTTSALPTNADFGDTAAGTGTGTFTFTPDETQLGDHAVTFIATDDSGGVASLPITITVDGPNLPPALDPLDDTVYVTEGDTLNLTISATDPNGTLPVITVSTLPSFVDFPDSNYGSGELVATPGFVDSGFYTISLEVSDFKPANSITFDLTLRVEDAGNQRPLLNPIEPPDTLFEGGSTSIVITAADPDETVPILSADNLDNAVFVDNQDGTGQLDFSPDCNQGSRLNGDSLHLISFYADDGQLVDTQSVEIVVVDTGNWKPEMSPVGSQNIDEGRYVDVLITADDCELGGLTIFPGPLPYNARFSDYGDGTGRFEFYPDYTQSEAYLISFFATDGEDTASEEISITVNNIEGDIVNDPGVTDTLRLIGSAWDGSFPGFAITCRISNDSAVAAASTGFHWEESWLTLDTLELEPWVEEAYYYETFHDSALQLFHIGFIFYDSLSLDSGNHAYFTARFTFNPDSVNTDTIWDISSRIHIDTAKVGNSGDFVFDPMLKGPPPAKLPGDDISLALSAETYAPLVKLQETREAADAVEISVFDVVNGRRLRDQDTIYVDGEELAYQLHLSLENRDSLNAMNLGLVMSSEDGAGWNWLPQIDGLGDITAAGTIASGSRMRDDDLVWPESGGLQFIETNVDGILADSLLFRGIAGAAEGAGLETGLYDHMISLTFLPDSLPDDTMVFTLCVDNIGVSQDWSFTDFSGSTITPAFSGRICFPVVNLEYTAIEEETEQIPDRYRLSQNYPNPFNPTTAIDFSLARRTHVTITVFNILGQTVKTLTDRVYDSGEHTVVWDGRNRNGKQAASGIYLYLLTSDEFNQARKMILLR